MADSSGQEHGLQLPVGVSAEDLLNNYSEKERAKIAALNKMALQKFDTCLHKRVREERLASTVSSVQSTLSQQRRASADRDPNQLKAEKAIVDAMRHLIQKHDPARYSKADLEDLEARAYRLCSRGSYSFDASALFRTVATAEAGREVDALIRSGVSPDKVRAQVADALKARSERQNLQEYAYALSRVADIIRHDGSHVEKRLELIDFVRRFDQNALRLDDVDLLRRLIACAQGAHFTKLTSGMVAKYRLQKYEPLMPDFVLAYKNHGPHKTKADKTTGAAEFEAGHAASGAIRERIPPRYDPSRGDGDT